MFVTKNILGKSMYKMNARRVLQLALLVAPLLWLNGAVATTYDDDMFPNIFNSNSQQACLDCHSSGLVGATNRSDATDGYDYDTYANATGTVSTVFIPTAINQRANLDGNMPPTGTPLTSNTLTNGINERALIADWVNDGAPKAAPAVSTFTEANITASVTKTSAILKATVNPNVHAATTKKATANFQYGETTSYGGGTGANGTTSTISNLTGTSGATQSATVSDLECGTTYHYRGNATNGDSTTNGTDRTFMTDACTPPTIRVGGISVASTSQSVDEDGSVTFTVTVTAGETGTLNWTVGTQGSKGTYDFNTGATATGTTVTVRYVPNGNANGSDIAGIIQVQNATTGSTDTLAINMTTNEIADTPSVTDAITDEDVQTTADLVITRNVVDSTAVTHFKITSIVGGTLFKNDGVTAISEGDFITRADGNAGLKFTGDLDRTTAVEGDGSFDVQGATDNVGGGLSAVAAPATIRLNAIDDAPKIDVAISDVTVLEDAADTEIRLGRAFTDVDNNDGLIIMSVVSNSNNTLVNASILGDRLTLDYQPDQFGTATIVIDGTSGGQTVEDTFVVTVTSQIDAPRIIEGATLRPAATATDASTTFSLNVTDVEAGTLTWSFPAQGTLGTYSVDASSTETSNPVTILYTPDSGVSGLDESGVILVTNGTTGLTDSIAMSIAVERNMGFPPTITEGATITPPNFDEDTSTTFVLNSNQFGAIHWAVDTQGSKGVFSIDSSATTTPVTIRYTPVTNENGVDASGVIRATNTMLGKSSTIAVTMNIDAVDDAPDIDQTSPFDVPQTNEDTPIIFVLSGSDVEAGTLTWSVNPQGAKGDFSFDSPTANPVTVTYQPRATEFGTDTAGMITLTNGTTGLSETIQINMTIVGVANPPVITEGNGPLILTNTNEDVDATFTLNVTDIETGTHLWRISSQGVNGVFSFDTTDTADSIDIRYTPTPDFNGDDTATFVVTNNSNGQIDFIKVDITVDPINDAPTITSAAPTTALVFTEEMPANIYQLTQTDIDDTSFTYSLGATSLPGDEGVGDMVISATGLITWTPPRSGIFNGATAMVTVTVSDVDAQSNVPGANVMSDTQMFSVSTVPVDTDADGVADYSDNCPTIANAGQEDLDNDTVHLAVDGSGVPADGDVDPTARDAVNVLGESYLNGGDVCDEDIDGDGLSNDFENLAENTFLDPLNAADALADQDGDELSNLAEFLAGTNVNLDSVGPVVTPPATITVNAVGSRTKVNIGQATAIDNADPAIDVVRVALSTTNLDDTATCNNLRNLPANPDTFRVGRTVVTWVVCDITDNLGMATQVINVVPLVSLSSGSVSGEGQAVSVDVMLNGGAATYPVTVAYQVSGTAVAGSDHNAATSGTVTFNAPSTVQSINFNVLNDALSESDETVVITLSSATNAVLGSNVVHTLTITDGNVAPQVNLANSQGGQARGALVYQTDGVVTVMANAVDANGDALTFNWNASDAALLAVATINGDNITFDPAALTAGTLYPVEVSVSDGTTSTTVNRLLSVKGAVAVTLQVGKDSDEDGITDDVEGLADSDGDGIPDYLDNAGTPPNVIESQTGNLSTAQVIETEPGLSIALGSTAIAADATGVHVSSQDVIDHGGAAGGLATNADTDYSFTDALFSFEIAGLTPSMQSVNVVLPLPTSIQNGVVYRKYIQATGWADFVEDDLNIIRSASGDNGVCPEPGSAAYTVGLTVLNNCLQLTIQDGGANDGDGLRNFIVKDPGGLALAPIDQAAIDAAAAAAEADANSTGRAGAMNPITILLLFMSVALVVSSRRR